MHPGLPMRQARDRDGVVAALGLGELLRQAPGVNLLRTPRLGQRAVRLLRPARAGLLKPRLRLRRLGFLGPALVRRLGVVAPEPLGRAARDPVIAALREHQMRVGVLPLAMMHGQRVGQPLAGAGGHRGRERPRQGDLLALGQLLG